MPCLPIVEQSTCCPRILLHLSSIEWLIGDVFNPMSQSRRCDDAVKYREVTPINQSIKRYRTRRQQLYDMMDNDCHTLKCNEAYLS